MKEKILDYTGATFFIMLAIIGTICFLAAFNHRHMAQECNYTDKSDVKRIIMLQHGFSGLKFVQEYTFIEKVKALVTESPKIVLFQVLSNGNTWDSSFLIDTTLQNMYCLSDNEMDSIFGNQFLLKSN